MHHHHFQDMETLETKLGGAGQRFGDDLRVHCDLLCVSAQSILQTQISPNISPKFVNLTKNPHSPTGCGYAAFAFGFSRPSALPPSLPPLRSRSGAVPAV